MAITITAYVFSKRSNSTKQPDDSGTDFSVSLKSATSYENPTFILNYSGTFAYNYMQWGSWYYFVTSVTQLRNDLLEINCKLDVLATFKAEIGATSAFVLYDTAANSEIIDTRLSHNSTPVYGHSYTASGIISNNYVCVMMGIVGQDSSRIWGMLPSVADDLLNGIDNFLDDPDALPYPSPGISTIDDAAEVLAHNLTSGFRYLISTGSAADCIKWSRLIPLSPYSFTVLPSADIYLGTYKTGKQGEPLQWGDAAHETVTVSIPWQFADWRNGSCCTEIYLTLPYCGTIALSADVLKGATAVIIETFVAPNGQIVYHVRANDAANTKTITIGTYTGNCGSDYMVGEARVSAFNQLGAGLSAVTGIAASIAYGGLGAVTAGAGAINGIGQAMQPNTSSVGGMGSGAYMSDSLYKIDVIAHPTNVDPTSVSAVIGTPTMAVKQIGTLSGYVQTQAASVAASCDETTRAEINALLDGGIYYE